MSFNNAAAARENARRRDGKFGHQLHSEAEVTLGAPAIRDFASPVPGYTGPRVPKGAPMGGMPTWMEAAGADAPAPAPEPEPEPDTEPAAPTSWGNAAPVPGYKGPLTPKGSANGGLPTWVNDAPREKAPALSPDTRALLDNDMRRILAHPGLTDTDKAQYKAMATALVEKGAGYVNAGFGQRVTFAPGTYYGGRPVPAAFAGFHAKLEADGKVAEARARFDHLSRTSPLRNTSPGEALAPAGTGYGRISANDFQQLESIRKSRHDAQYVAPAPVIAAEQEALLVEMSSNEEFMRRRQAARTASVQEPAKKSLFGKLLGK